VSTSAPRPDSNIQWRSRVRLVDEVVEVLRAEIYAGRFPLGTPLRQEQLASELQVSRTPLREALRMLEREGLVRVEPGRSVRVTSGDLSTLLDAYALREVVDGLAARLAAEKGDSEGLRRLDAILKHQQKAVAPWDPPQYTALNVDFHRALMEMTGNDFLVAQMPLVHMTSQVFVPIRRVSEERAVRAIQEHAEIATAVHDGAGEKAEELAREHIRHTVQSFIESTDPSGEDPHAGEDPPRRS
jgi:DNA-binding GntR family transcriptional regulator